MKSPVIVMKQRAGVTNSTDKKGYSFADLVCKGIALLLARLAVFFLAPIGSNLYLLQTVDMEANV
ncbi:hypothetical protein GCM10008933_45590 [Paenibacillus motobuensis]|uniref:Uncharacterized protein n=1 Tax=Paenibacillus motobuensis TaxID=295324 RepID=A0ABN0YTN4_9BACL